MGNFENLDPVVDFQTLGWHVIDFLESSLAMPDGKGGALSLTSEQARIILEFYRVDGLRRRYRRGVVMTSKGWGTSPMLAMFCAAEALADVVPSHYDDDGNIVGKPWRDVRTPYVQVAAVSEGQTTNVWDCLLEMLREGPATELFPGLEVFDTFVKLPERGEMIPITSSFRSQEGKKPVFVAMDQTEAWVTSNGGVAFAKTCRRNATKVGGTTIEGPNAFTPGDGSVAEKSFNTWSKIKEGKTRLADDLMFIYREAPADTDLSDKASLMAGLRYVYGDACAWMDLERVCADIWDPDNDVDDSRRFFLNQMTQATDAWLARDEWMACYDQAADHLEDGELITLGFDGSRKRMKGVTDATVLHACRLSDGKLFEIMAWEQPEGPEADAWEVPLSEVDLTVRDCFKRYRVIGFYADPAKWESYTDTWEADFGKDLKVKSHSNHPIQFWLTGAGTARFIPALRRFHDDVISKELVHAGDPVTTRHVLNARRRSTRYGISIAKATPDSPNKIDGAISACLAYAARNAAIAAGIEAEERKPKKSKRLIRR
jgi:hypothetical protein